MGSISDLVSDQPLRGLESLYADTTVLKIWKTARELLDRENPPDRFPETVPQTGACAGQYQLRDAEFWTCGFFPGSVYCLLERCIRYPDHFLSGDYQHHDSKARIALQDEVLHLCRRWSEPLHAMAHRKDTHDIGFIIGPALRRDYELTNSSRSLQSIIIAAHSLASRYDARTKAIRSWDKFINNRHLFDTKESGFLVIIDSMCNLDLLYYAGHHSGSRDLIDIATMHAHTVMRTLLRVVPGTDKAKYPEFATCHVANLCATSGDLVSRLTAQGFSDTSTWARGQAWAILGYAQTYHWTKNLIFLRTACGLAQHFIRRMEEAPQCVEVKRQYGKPIGRHVPLWDFDAPVNEKMPLRDSSAGMIAANGMLLLYSGLTATGDSEGAATFLHHAMAIVTDTIQLCYAPDRLALAAQSGETESGKRVIVREDNSIPSFDALLRNATANFNEDWTDKFSDHGLVYGDYYLLEFGNRLLEARLI